MPCWEITRTRWRRRRRAFCVFTASAAKKACAGRSVPCYSGWQGNLLPFNQPAPRTPEELLLEKETQRSAEQVLAKLSQKEQDCLELRYGGLSYREVAGILQLSPNTVGPLMARALRKFREAYVELVEKKDASHESGGDARGATPGARRR